MNVMTFTCVQCGHCYYSSKVTTLCPICFNEDHSNKIKGLKCECGAHSVGVDKHSDWCILSQVSFPSENMVFKCPS